LITLYGAPGSCSLAAHWCLEEAGAEFELRPVNLAGGEQRESVFRAVNPHGRVPVLTVPGQTITELPAILTFVAAEFPQARLMPYRDAADLAKLHERMCWLSSTAHVVIAQIFRSERFSDDPETQARIQEFGKAKLPEVFAEIDGTFARYQEFAMGSDFTVIDPYPFVFYNWGLRLKMDMRPFAAWTRHTRNLAQRPAAGKVFQREGWLPHVLEPG
jgi:glutathione S-transferase